MDLLLAVSRPLYGSFVLAQISGCVCGLAHNGELEEAEDVCHWCRVLDGSLKHIVYGCSVGGNSGHVATCFQRFAHMSMERWSPGLFSISALCPRKTRVSLLCCYRLHGVRVTSLFLKENCPSLFSFSAGRINSAFTISMLR